MNKLRARFEEAWENHKGKEWLRDGDTICVVEDVKLGFEKGFQAGQQDLLTRLREPNKDIMKAVYNCLTSVPCVEVYKQESTRILKAIADELEKGDE